MNKDQKYIIAVDFDGFLFEDNWPFIGAPIIRNIALVKGLKEDGHKIILWTCRVKEELFHAVCACHKQGLGGFDAINANLPETIEKYGCDSRKITADFYLDDRNTTYEKMQILFQTGKTEEEYVANFKKGV